MPPTPAGIADGRQVPFSVEPQAQTARPTFMARRVLLALVVVFVATACSGTDETPSAATTATGGTDTPPSLGATPSHVVFVVNYDPSEYSGEDAQGAFAACTGLPGAKRGDQADSLPPIQTVVFTGTSSERKAVEACLRALPGATVTER